MLKEAEALQKSLTQAQSELRKIEVRGFSSGGLVEVIMNAQGELKDIKIKKEAVNLNDLETLEDLIILAFRDAGIKALDISKEKLGNLTKEMNFPPI